jgi:hypothetical protein
MLLDRQRHACHIDVGSSSEIERKAAADVKDALAWTEEQFRSEVPDLLRLRLL